VLALMSVNNALTIHLRCRRNSSADLSLTLRMLSSQECRCNNGISWQRSPLSKRLDLTDLSTQRPLRSSDEGGRDVRD